MNVKTLLVLELQVKVIKCNKSKKPIKKIERLTKASIREKEKDLIKDEIEYDDKVTLSLSEEEIV